MDEPARVSVGPFLEEGSGGAADLVPTGCEFRSTSASGFPPFIEPSSWAVDPADARSLDGSALAKDITDK